MEMLNPELSFLSPFLLTPRAFKPQRCQGSWKACWMSFTPSLSVILVSSLRLIRPKADDFGKQMFPLSIFYFP